MARTEPATESPLPQSVPLTWSPTENIVWQADVPGRGHSSPVTWGRRVFVTTADDENQVQSILAYDRDTGKQLWETVANRGNFMPKSHRHNSHASATSACDGERLFSVFVHDGGLWVTATDLDGKILWQTKAGDYDAIYGYGSSPAIWQSLVIVLGDNDQTGSFMAAIHRKTGQIVWRIARPNIDTYATPIVAHLAGRDQLLVGGCGYLTSYDPATGKEFWKCAGPTTETTANTATWSDDCVFVSGGYPKPYTLMAVKARRHGRCHADAHAVEIDQPHAVRVRRRCTMPGCCTSSTIGALPVASMPTAASRFGFIGWMTISVRRR